MDFEWDPRKDLENQHNHAVSFHEALTVFADPMAKIFDDPHHSTQESREIIIGHSTKNRLLIVCFTERMTNIRIISARLATRQERRDYEQST